MNSLPDKQTSRADDYSGWRRVIVTIGQILARSFRLSPLATIVAFLETVGRVLSALIPWFLGLVVTGLTIADQRLVYTGLFGIVAAIGASTILRSIGTHARMSVMERVGQHFDAQIAMMGGDCPTLDHFESTEFLNRTQSLKEDRGILGGVYNMLMNVIHNAATPITLAVVALGADWRMIFVLFAVVPVIAVTKYSVTAQANAEEMGAEYGRLAGELQRLAFDPRAGAEIRVFRAQDWLLEKIRVTVSNWRAPHTNAVTKSSLLLGLACSCYFLIATIVIAFITADTLAGRVELGALIVAIGVLSQLSGSASNVNFITQAVGRLVRMVKRYLWLKDYTAAEARKHAGVNAAPESLNQGIEFKAVNFSYPGSYKLALAEFNVQLPAGSIVAVVGENGAGKSTLVKLLTGMYDTEGEVLIDGVPLTELNLDSWRSECSGAFQDHHRFELLAWESIGIGDLENFEDRPRIEHALARASATEIVAGLPKGLDTQLGSQWKDGVGLSGGQWQRLAIARGLMRENPLLLVLDEPTSALDAATESALFDSYVVAAREVSANRGAITILVTHRFATAKDADLILVLDHGRLVEQGTHVELLAAQGKYAEMYELQAAGYR